MHLAIRGIVETFGGLHFSAYRLAERVELCGVVNVSKEAVLQFGSTIARCAKEWRTDREDRLWKDGTLFKD